MWDMQTLPQRGGGARGVTGQLEGEVGDGPHAPVNDAQCSKCSFSRVTKSYTTETSPLT